MDTRFERLEQLIKAFADPFEDKEIIYHYTSADGLKGIVESNELWLTNTVFVNDTTECKALQEKRDMPGKDILSNLDVALAYCDMIFKQKADCNNRYIISFSKRDLLSQWRGYGSFCIGFAAKELVRNGFTLHKCLYEEKEIMQWILDKAKMPEWNGEWKKEKWEMESNRSWQLKYAADYLMSVASVKYKNASYSEEQEIRLTVVSDHDCENDFFGKNVYKSQPPIHFRVDPTLKVPVPYVKFFISNGGKQEAEQGRERTIPEIKDERIKKEQNQKRELLPIKEVIVGPMVHQKEAEIACEILLGEKGYNAPVNRSEIPYRGF